VRFFTYKTTTDRHAAEEFERPRSKAPLTVCSDTTPNMRRIEMNAVAAPFKFVRRAKAIEIIAIYFLALTKATDARD